MGTRRNARGSSSGEPPPYSLRAGFGIRFGTLEQVRADFEETRRRIAAVEAGGGTEAIAHEDEGTDAESTVLRWATAAELEAEFEETKRRIAEIEHRRTVRRRKP